MEHPVSIPFLVLFSEWSNHSRKNSGPLFLLQRRRHFSNSPKVSLFSRSINSMVVGIHTKSGNCKQTAEMVPKFVCYFFLLKYFIFYTDLYLGPRQWRLVDRPPIWPQCNATNGHNWDMCGRFHMLCDLY